MVILLVKIKNRESLMLNEFFDYGGQCYAISQNRDSHEAVPIKMDDFFDASIMTEELAEVPVVFVDSIDGDVIGWYKKATVYSEIKRPSLFLEGNIVAKATDVVLLPDNRKKIAVVCEDIKKSYEIVEVEDKRYSTLFEMIQKYSGDNAFLRYPYTEAKMISSAVKSVESCTEACEYYASNLIENCCKDLSEIKKLEVYAKKLTELAPKSADGYYYLAMARCHLGFPKKGIKDIEKALKVEPDAADIIAQKGLLLYSMNYHDVALQCFNKAYDISKDEQYLLFVKEVLLEK